MKNILIPIDGSVHSINALKMGFDLAEKFDAQVTVVTVRNKVLPTEFRHFADVEFNGLTESKMLSISERLGKKMIQETLACAEVNLECRQEVLFGDPALMISEYVETHNIDVIVMGSRGLSAFKGLFMGSVSHQVNHLVSCTCINVK